LPLASTFTPLPPTLSPCPVPVKLFAVLIVPTMPVLPLPHVIAPTLVFELPSHDGVRTT
jgi:hypothetical protein